ncbi:hypothetical protein VTL71DRAFT_2350 [Oculimacula yallundae]|uniref:FAD-binding FR-type domain-containing protein n=1 Tax=Oculimacula yallundae TaxID=86028 RepID=A0ABR4C8N0_9HELO
MSLLCLLHVLLALASKDPFSLDNTQDLFAVIGGSSLGLLLLLAFPIVRKLSYEVFLRTHQALSLLLTFAIWQHLPSDKNFPRGYIYISSGLYVAMLILQAGSVVFHNGIFRHHLSRAALTHDNGAVKIRLKLQEPLEIGPGTYINLWIPAVSFGAFLQSHPFMVISWGSGKQHIIDLLIEPQRGLTRDLLYHAKRDNAADFLVIFSGPHGTSVPMDEYESILMVASGFGIATHLPYLKRLIYGYNSRRVQARRIHLVWQIRHKADAVVAQSLLNDALKDDRLDDGCILSISIYLESNDIPTFPFGKRATIYPGVAPLSGIFLEEVLGKHIKKPEVDTIQYGTKAIGLRNLKTILEDAEDIESMEQRKSAREGKMLVTVSGYDDIRDQLRGLTREYLEEGVSLVELDYQPK